MIGIKSVELKNMDIKINCGELVGIIGQNGSGKSTLLKMISGRINNDYLYIDSESVHKYNIDYKKNNIVCVFDDNIYNTNNVRSELEYYLNKLNLTSDIIDSRISDFIDYFKLDKIINSDFISLSVSDRIYIKILSLLIINSKLFCIDDLLTYLSLDKKVKVLNYIKENNITLLCVTSNMEELKYFDKILVINKGKKEMFDKTEVVLKNEVLFRELGISLPFIYDLNNMLKSYELVDEYHLIEKELVDLLWK